MKTYSLLEKNNLQQELRTQFNEAIEIGLSQLATGNKISAAESYHRLKRKIRKNALLRSARVLRETLVTKQTISPLRDVIARSATPKQTKKSS